jgi:hypothetical protein
MHGYTRQEFIGLHLTAYIHPDSQPLFNDAARDVQPKSLFNVPAVHVRKDGSSFYVDVRRTAIQFQMMAEVLTRNSPPRQVTMAWV